MNVKHFHPTVKMAKPFEAGVIFAEYLVNNKAVIFRVCAPICETASKDKADFVDDFSRRYLEEHFLTLNYGPDVEEIVIAYTIIKTKPGYEEWYKPKRPKYTEYGGWITFGPGGPKDRERRKEFWIDYRIDGDLYDAFIEADEEQAICILACEILNSLELLDKLPKRLKQFDKERFKSDVSDYFQQQGWI